MPISAYTPLLKTKIILPPPRPQGVTRPRLLERLQEGLTRTLTLISAPAGFGKTTLVTSWLHEAGDRPRVSWFALDEDDNDPAHFVTLDALGHLALLMHAQGRLREAIRLCRNAADQYVDVRGRPLPVTGLVFVPLGVLHYEVNDLESARHRN